MKKIKNIIILIVVSVLLQGISYANQNLGSATFTDIITCINHIPIQSHNFNGEMLIAVEDLKDFGFTVKWNEYKRIITVTRNTNNNITIPFVTCATSKDIGKKEFDIKTTDVEVYIGGHKCKSYGGIDGYTLINVNDLAYIDNVKVEWVPEVRTVKVWVEDGLEMVPYIIRPVPDFIYYDYYNAPPYRYYWEYFNYQKYFSLTFYMLTDFGNYVNNEDGVLTITDVIDADGNSILKSEVASPIGISIVPYRLQRTDKYLSVNVFLSSDDLLPKTASEDGGIIKFTYKHSKYGSVVISDSIRVSQLPYYSN